MDEAADPQDDNDWGPFDYDLSVAGEVLADCENDEDVFFLFSVLKEHGIRSAIVLPDHRYGDLRWPHLRVAPEDVEAARTVLNDPSLPELKKQRDSDPEPELPPLEPLCSKCGSNDVVLDGVVPDNQWRCEQCGHAWLEKLDLTPESAR